MKPEKFVNPLEVTNFDDATVGDFDDMLLVSTDEERAKRDHEIKLAAFGTADVDDTEAALDAHFRTKWKGILHPETPTRATYDMAQLAIMLYLGYVLPVRQAFKQAAHGPLMVIVDILVDCSVWVDMFLQMRMCYYDKKTKKLMCDQKEIKKHYIHTWFFIDFFSVVPADQVLLIIGTLLVENTTSVAGSEWGVRLMEWSVTARLMRLLRLVRLAKIRQLLNLDKVTHVVYSLVKSRTGFTKLQVSFFFRVIFLVALITASGHFLGCVWLMLGRHSVLELQNPQGWMLRAYEQETINKTRDYVACSGGGFNDIEWNSVHGSSCAHQYKCIPVPAEHPYDVDCSWIKSRSMVLGGNGADNGVGASEGEQYLSAFYFALVTLTTVGYGDILPDTEAEKKFVMTCIIFGAFIYAYIIGDFTNLLTNLSHERDEFDRKMRTINDLLGYINAPPEVRDKVQDYYDFKFENKEGSTALMAEMPSSLQLAIVKHRYGDLITRVPFFASMQDKALVDLCQKMKSFTVTPGDLIMTKGEWHDELLILSKGVAKTMGGEDGQIDVYEVGSFWGEMQFLGLEKQRTLSVIADTYSEIASLSPVDIPAGSIIHSRLSAYAKLRAEIEAKLNVGEAVDMDSLHQELERRFAAEIKGEDEAGEMLRREPPVMPSRDEDRDAVITAQLVEMQHAQRQTDTQLNMISQQVKELAASSASTNAQLQELMAAVKMLGGKSGYSVE